MELGTVVYKENIPYVITKITNGQVNETVKLEDYITKNVFIKHQGEYKTLRNIIEMHCKKYLSTHEAIEIKDVIRSETMEKLISLKVNSFDDKEKLISALASNGYLVTAELEKDKFVTSRTNGWRVDIYKKPTKQLEMKPINFDEE